MFLRSQNILFDSGIVVARAVTKVVGRWQQPIVGSDRRPSILIGTVGLILPCILRAFTVARTEHHLFVVSGISFVRPISLNFHGFFCSLIAQNKRV
jgi:hypothetical protein